MPLCSIVWNTDGSSRLCDGGSQCWCYVLYRTGSLYYCISDRVWICSIHGHQPGGLSCDEYSGTYDRKRNQNGYRGTLLCRTQYFVLHGTERISAFYAKYLKNVYVRVVVASVAIIVITKLLGTTDYMGAGTGLIAQAIEHGNVRTLDFFWKLVLTVLTMRAGFRGGEIVPSFCIGATFGCVLGHILGLSPSICAASGMVALFCGVTNCPLTSILIAFELFGFEGVSYYLIAVSISYAASGYYGLYKDQTIVYSKYKAKYVNHHTKM